MSSFQLDVAHVMQPLLGGAFIGLGASALYGLIGRIAGVSGIVAGLIRPKPGEWGWRLAFVLGIVLVGTLAGAFAAQPGASGYGLLPLIAIVPAGFCVGFGARLGGGCTSGHGVCGISRLSRRSIVATMTFIAAGCAAVTFVRFFTGSHS